jgi:acyl transferase domain-containing protein/thioesterase domain-containing protein/NAD(P)-dependent dehydrogenase (short-subunit alcohol dehydrogenase family)/acyl carrier protein
MTNQDLLDSLNGSEIAIVGMAGRFPRAKNPDEFWQNIRDGVECISRFTDEDLRAAGVDDATLRNPNYVRAGGALEDMEMFDGAFFGLGPRDSSIMDPQHRHFIETCWEALENAGYDPARFDGSIGVYGGSGMNAYMPLNLMTNPEIMNSIGFFLVRHTGNDKDFMTTRVSYLFNLKGPSINVQTACSTSLVAMHIAAQSLLNQECDMALAGGVTIELPHRRGYMYHSGEILSPDGHCRAFDDSSQGTVFGSGVGVVVLKRLEDAINDGDTIHAIMRGSAINNDGSGKISYLAPSVDGQAAAIAEALAIADVPADTITYVETHGTGTYIGDPIEVSALTQAFRASTKKKGYCGIGSVKTNIGHLDTAAGVASVIKAVQALKHKQLPPSLNFEKPNKMIDFESSPFYVNAQLRDWNVKGIPRRAGVSSLGVGGTNAHIILEEAPILEPSSESRSWQLLQFSAKTNTALDKNLKNLADHLKNRPEQNLADVAYTLQVGRSQMSHRRILVAQNAEDAVSIIENGDRKRIFSQNAPEYPPPVVFMFPGGAAQYPNMGRGLYDEEPVYRETLDECFKLLKSMLDFDLKNLMFPADSDIEQAAFQLEKAMTASLPAIFITEYAQAKLWMSWGIEPETMIGHSLGEYTAACLSGVMSLKDALSMVVARAKLMDTLPEGGMLSIPLSEDEVRPLLPNDVSIAVINSPSMCAVSGTAQAIDNLEQSLTEKGIEYRRLKLSVAAHSPVLDPILEEFGKHVAKIKLQAPAKPYITNLTGTWAKPDDVAKPEYWVRHLRQTVRFADGIAELMSDPTRILLEVGPGNALSSIARQHPNKPANAVILSSLRHPRETDPDMQFMLTTLGRLWASGCNPDWTAFYEREQRYRVPLPTYAFDHQRFWIDPGKQLYNNVPESTRATLAKLPDIGDWFYRPVWKQAEWPERSENPAHESGWLVFVDECGLGTQIADQLETAGHDVTIVTPGYQFTQLGDSAFAIDPRSRQDYTELVKHLSNNGGLPRNIAHFWPVTVEKPIESRVTFFEECQNSGFYSLLFLSQAFAEEAVTDPVHIWVISNGMQQVNNEAMLYPEKAPLLGPVKVIPQEFPNIITQSIDVVLSVTSKYGLQSESSPLADQIVAELFAPPANAIIAYRDGQRWIQDFEPARLEKPANEKSSLREGGVYLITGGLGGIGLVHAEYLARAAHAKLVLIGRTGLPARDEWTQWLDSHSAHDKISRQIRKAQKLESLGAEILAVSADVSDRMQMRTAIGQAYQRFGAIHGVIHAAGVLGDGLIQLKTLEQVENVFAPKVRGALMLDDLLKDAKLDFFILFSSTSTAIASAGQVDYTGANAFLNAFADSKSAQSGTHTVAINWGLWSEVGMAVAAAVQAGLASDDEDVSGKPMKHPLLGEIITDTPDQIVYSADYRANERWILDQHRLKNGQALIPGTGYLEIAKAALEKDAPQGTVEIRDLSFKVALEVNDDETRRVRVTLDKSSSGFNFAVTSKVPGEIEWQEHVSGKVAYANATPQRYDIEALRQRMNGKSVTFGLKEQFTRQENHLLFGPRWKVLRQMNFGVGEALAYLELPAEFADDMNQYAMHPALMDLATGYGLPLVENYESINDLFVPFSYKNVRAFAPLPPKIYSYVRLTESSKEFVVLDVTIMDENGATLVEVNGFKMRRIDPAKLTTQRAETKQPRQAADNGKPNLLQLALTDGILPEEGVEVFSRILANGKKSQVIASSLDLRLLSDKLNARPEAESAGTGMKFSRPENMQSDYAAPRNEIEKKMVVIWQEVLGIETVGIYDDFFELGGESLIGVRLFTQIRKAFGINLPLDSLFTTPSVAQVSEIIAEEIGEVAPAQPATTSEKKPRKKLSHRSLLVGIQPEGNRPTLFCVHDQNGYVLLYRELADHLGKDQPFYAIKARGVDGSYDFDLTVEDMAARYVQEMREFQPEGPYYIAGSSLGGLIAFDMAQKLRAQDQEVALLAMFDSWTPKNLINWLMPPQETVKDRAMKHVREILTRGPAGYYSQRVENRKNYQEYLNKLSQIEDMRQEIAEYLKNKTIMPPDLLSYHLEEIYGAAYRNYEPHDYPGKMTLFRATERSNPRDNAPLLGWDEYPIGEIEIHHSPGPHGYMVREPHVRALAQQLRECIDRAEREMLVAAK